MSHSPLLQVEQLIVDVGGRPVVDRVSFSIESEQTLALVGESGSGKSMTAAALMRLLPAAAKVTQGKLLLQGQELLRLPEQKMRRVRGLKMGMIFQEPMVALNPVLKVGEQIGEVLRLHQGMSRRQAQQRGIELLDCVGIRQPAQTYEQYPHQLSGGMRQRVVIASALAGQPDLLIADEPTTALDVTIQAQVLDLMKDLQNQFGTAILFITHDLGVVHQVADDVAVMRQGEIVEQASSAQFFKAPQHEYSQALFAALPQWDKREAEFRRPTEHDENTSLGMEEGRVHFAPKRRWFRSVGETVRAVDDVTLAIPEGRTLALVGESGSGKTTLAKALLQLQAMQSGCIQWSGERVTLKSAQELMGYRRRVQVVFQDPFSSLNPRMLVGEILNEGMRTLRPQLSAEEARQEAESLLEEVGLPKNASQRYPHEFSGGQRQRIGIARALAVNPEVLILDEPTSALDVSVQEQILKLLNRLQQERGLSYLLITHDIAVVEYFADQVAVMERGKIVEQGHAEAVLFDPQHPYTQKLIAAVPRLSVAAGED
ncbi:ABC superfamily transporter, ATP-binding component [gamma proteobacterium HTCC5015]|nr:ABC superfamily transporter, ATP-binding component [gamma proteobacterium HTCC5015]